MSAQAAPVGASISSTAPAARSRTSRVLRQIRRRPIESVGGVILILVVLTAMFAGFIAPFDYAAQEFGAAAGLPVAGTVGLLQGAAIRRETQRAQMKRARRPAVPFATR
mgnify:CR=1 FL=1